MKLTEEDREEYNKILVEHYGDINSWETNHWMHFNALMECLSESNWGKEDRIKEDLNAGLYAEFYEKEAQSLTLQLEAHKLLDLAKKMEHVEGLEPDEKFFIANKLRDDGRSLLQECIDLMQEGKNSADEHTVFLQEGLNLAQHKLDNIETYIPKKPVGRPSSKFLYQWMDYLVSELGSIQKAANYASTFPMIEYKKPDSLKRQYRKYSEDKGEE
jgi:hypothetical protein